jgi:phosphoserine phosphatase RsbU/P
MTSGRPGATPHVQPHRSAGLPATDLYLIADLMHQPKSTTAAGRVRGRPDLAGQRIADLALVLHLTKDLVIGDPQSYRAWPAGVGKRVRGQFRDGDDEIADSVRPQTSLVCPGSCELPDASQAGRVLKLLGSVRGRAQRPTGPRPRRSPHQRLHSALGQISRSMPSMTRLLSSNDRAIQSLARWRWVILSEGVHLTPAVGQCLPPCTVRPGSGSEDSVQVGGAEVTTPGSRAALEDRLRGIQSITDAALSRLDDQEFLAELLERTRAVLQADTAAVLLLDFTSGHLIATAAAGLEEEVLQGVRIPVGRGFAGRIAAEHKPVILEQVDHSTVLNPILLSKGIRALMGVPLISGGRVIGVLHVGSLTQRQFTREDLELLQLAGDRAASALASLIAHEDRIAAERLQRSLLPSALPTTGDAEMAVRYVPGRGKVGGDWYDVFTLPSGQLGVVIGDVVGSGLAAAVIMGRMRSALRAYALETDDPEQVLARLDRKMQHFEPGAMATVLYAVFEPRLDVVRICSAGHYPPVIASPGRSPELAEIPPGMLIGAVGGARRQVVTMKVAPGTVFCFYTDGLIERRGELIDDGLSRLCQVVTTDPPETGCAVVMAALVGSEVARDDIALLMVRRRPPGSRR